jgi:3-methyl-2-oxobutanoate hydroxymethyltransferase
MIPKISIIGLLEKKKRHEKITMLTAYDAPSSKLAEAGGVDLILIGDSLAMTVLGYPSTKQITIAEMLHHVRAVARGAQHTHLIGDLPIGTYDTPAAAVMNARSFMDAGCDSVKFEGHRPEIAQALVQAGIPAVGHIGLTPQTAESFKVQGKSMDEQVRLLNEAHALAAAQIFLLIIECVPAILGKLITEAVNIPTVGIGAGPACDGQVLVFNDLVGLFEGFKPKFVRRYADFAVQARTAIKQYITDVKNGSFPANSESY